MSNPFEMMPRFETETRARRPDLGRQVNSGAATAPRRRLVRRPAGELPEVPTLRKATAKMVATFKVRGLGFKAKAWEDAIPSIAPESFEPVMAPEPRRKIVRFEGVCRRIPVTGTMQRKGYAYLLRKANKKGWTIRLENGVAALCGRCFPYKLKLSSCTDAKCANEYDLYYSFCRTKLVSPRYVTTDGDFDREVSCLRSDERRARMVADNEYAKWGERWDARRKLRKERTDAGILAAAGE